MRTAIPTFATAAAALALAGCGGGSSSPRSEPDASVARTEVHATRAALNTALATYRGGDRAAAVDQVAEAYASHFEEAEGPLDPRDHALKERLEHAIGQDLRAHMKAGRPAAAIKREVGAIVADLDRAGAALR